MGAMCVLRKTLCPTLKGCKLGYLVFHRRGLEPRVLPWQQHGRCYCFFYDVHFGAKLLHCSDVSGDILDSVVFFSV